MRVPQRQLSVVIPVYNEGKTLSKIVQLVLRQKEVLEVIIVDDGSTDGSLTAAQKLINSDVTIIRHKKNLGKGAAMISGLRKVGGQWVIFQDADLELNPSDYKKLLEPLIKNEADFVIGNRWKNKKGFFWPQLGNRFLTATINLLFGTSISDSYCGYKVTSRKIWRSLNLKSSRFEIEAEIIAKVGLKKFMILEVDVNYKPRTYKEGKKIKAFDAVRGLATLINLKFKGIN